MCTCIWSKLQHVTRRLIDLASRLGHSWRHLAAPEAELSSKLLCDRTKLKAYWSTRACRCRAAHQWHHGELESGEQRHMQCISLLCWVCRRGWAGKQGLQQDRSPRPVGSPRPTQFEFHFYTIGSAVRHKQTLGSHHILALHDYRSPSKKIVIKQSDMIGRACCRRRWLVFTVI